MIHKLKLVTFDVTGTLLKFRKPPFQIYLDFGHKYGIDVDPDELNSSFKNQWKIMNKNYPHFGTCWRTWWTKFVVGTFKGTKTKMSNANIEQMKLLAEELIEHFRTEKCWELKPGASDLLKQLEAYNSSKTVKDRVGVGVISNFDPRLREILHHLKISHHFQFLALSNELQISKPNPAIFNFAYEQYFKRNNYDGEVCKQCLHVGDNYELDYIGATAAGWKGALILSKEQHNDLPSKLSDNVVFNSLQEFSEHLAMS